MTSLTHTESPNQSLDALELLRNDFAFHCIRLRKRLKLTQTNFAKLMGLNAQEGKIAVSRWESGKHKPQARHLEKFMELQNQFDNKNGGD